jgi:hypothetical protein
MNQSMIRKENDVRRCRVTTRQERTFHQRSGYSASASETKSKLSFSTQRVCSGRVAAAAVDDRAFGQNAAAAMKLLLVF